MSASQIVEIASGGVERSPSQGTETSPIRASIAPSGPVVAPSIGPSGPVVAPSIAPSGPVVAPSIAPSGPTTAAGPRRVARVVGQPTERADRAGLVHGQAGGWIPPSNSSGGVSDGAPNRSLGIPPTRPAQQRRVAGLTITNKQLAIGGGALGLLVIVVIAVFASGGDSRATTRRSTTSRSSFPTEPTSDPIPPILDRGNQLIASDDAEAAVDLLTKARKAIPDNAQLALTLGRAYFQKLWWSEGVRNFRDAIKLDPEVASDPEMLKAVLKGFLTTPDIDDRIADFMVELGDPMKAFLKETADTHPNKQLRARAAAMLRRFK